MNLKKKRELIEWGILILIVGIIYIGGWQTEVIGKLQQGVLATGIIKPTLTDGESVASYDFQLKDESGKIIPFDSFKGHVVFLNFWATWCPPCVAEMPDIHSLYKKTGDSVSFVMVSMDKNPSKAIEFMKAKDYDFPVYFLHSSLPSTYNVRSIPTTYVLSKNGEVKVANHGMAKYDSDSFRTLLSELQ